jgi:mono/diheme cytochrome c family protein
MEDSMPRSALAVAAILAAGVVAAGAPSRAAEPDGKALFATKCALCHGRDGVPPPAFAQKKVPDMSSAAWQKATSDAQLKKVISEGVPGTMMRSFAADLKPAEIEAIITHIRTLGAAKK